MTLGSVKRGAEDDFGTYFRDVEPRLRAALVAVFGPDDGREACADALAWGWTNWELLKSMENPDGYLYRVGRNQMVRHRQRESRYRELPSVREQWKDHEYEPALIKFLAELPERQRVCVWMVHGLGHTLAETARLVGCSRSSVATHVNRALGALRSGLEVDRGN